MKRVTRVFARITFNNWISFDDIDCNLIPLGGLAPASFSTVLYQRYVFEKTLPAVPSAAEPTILGQNSIMFAFCVTFDDNEQRWDNHFGRNYTLEVVPCGPNDDSSLITDVSPAFGVVAHKFGASQPGSSILTEEEQRYKSQLRAMSPEYTYYNESSEFYW